MAYKKRKTAPQTSSITDYFARAPVRKRKAEDSSPERPSVVVAVAPPQNDSMSEASETRRQTPVASSDGTSEGEESSRSDTPPSRKKSRVSASSSCQSTPPSPNSSKADLSSSTPLSDASPTTPQDETMLDLPPLDALLDINQKTARLIAQIKANAEAQVSQPETPPRPVNDFKDELSDSDDDDLQPIPRPTAPEASKPQVPESSRHSMRIKNRVSLRHGARQGSSSRSSPKSIAPQKASPRANPLTALLREKAKAKKNGGGEDVILTAERIAAERKQLQDCCMEEDDIDDDDMLDGDHKPGEVQLVFEETDRQRLFGSGGGRDINDILRADRADQVINEAYTNRIAVGVHLWEDSPDTMYNEPLPIFPPVKGMEALRQAYKSKDHSNLAFLVSSTLCLGSTGAIDQDLVYFLCDLALHPSYIDWGGPIVATLLNLWNGGQSTSFPPQLLPKVLIRLGAKPSTLLAVGITPPQECGRCPLSSANREMILHRFMSLITASSTCSTLPTPSTPDFFLAMVLISMDPTVEPVLRRGTIVVLHELCRPLNLNDPFSKSMEVEICNRLLKFGSSLTLANQLHLLQMTGVGARTARRVARWVSYGLLAHVDTIPHERYGQIPPLVALLQILGVGKEQDEASCVGLFDLNPDTDFVDLRFRVKILGFALTELELFGSEDKQLPKGSPCIPPHLATKTADKPKTGLDTLHQSLVDLHSKIVDTRVADLSKSRAKAALQELATRIHYQKNSKRSHGGGNLKHYFPHPSQKSDDPFA